MNINYKILLKKYIDSIHGFEGGDFITDLWMGPEQKNRYGGFTDEEWKEMEKLSIEVRSGK